MKKMIVACLLVILTGCSTPTAGLRIDSKQQNVIFGDNVLGQRLQVNDIIATEVDGRVRGVVTLESFYRGDQHIQYRFYWYDDQGLEVNTKLGPWKQMVVRGEEIVTISEVSVNPNGREFRVQIRQADK
ncbi:YcfL family protein [Vibrio sp. WXL210]|uniref:YcfL family protein n=1 Tax=Vibrio sp. WXL210 TaxID=3450709 RepID=UPI003EC4ECB8